MPIELLYLFPLVLRTAQCTDEKERVLGNATQPTRGMS